MKNIEKFSGEQVTKLNHLNELLKKQEKRLLMLSKKLQSSLIEYEEKKEIDHYRLDCLLQVFIENDKCHIKNDKDKGTLIYEESLFIYEKEKLNDLFYTDDWNWLDSSHSFSKISFCYSMYCIASKSKLTWEDILLIDYIWIDIKVDYLLMINTKK